jgi:CRISPR/Cas system-associated protein Csx1
MVAESKGDPKSYIRATYKFAGGHQLFSLAISNQ